MEIHLLLVDADESHRAGLSAQLRRDGFAVSSASGTVEALGLAHQRWPHLVLTDLELPDGPAERLASRLNRQGDLPFLVVTPNDDADGRVRALTRFAEDYVTRPYRYDELLARIRRVLRRSLISSPIAGERVRLGDDRWIDLSRREIRRDGQVQHLTPTEARLLGLLLRNAGQVLPSPLILQRVWADTPVGVNTLWEYIRRLRIKLGDDAESPRYIVSARGVGYRFQRGEGSELSGRAPGSVGQSGSG